jgi:hypothetical protein
MPFPAFVNQPGAIPCKISDTIVGHMCRPGFGFSRNPRLNRVFSSYAFSCGAYRKINKILQEEIV